MRALTNSLKTASTSAIAQRRNDYGFTFGGPIRIPKVYDGHDKTFFFFNFEQYRETLNIGTESATVPIAAYLQGNFAGALGGQMTVNDPTDPRLEKDTRRGRRTVFQIKSSIRRHNVCAGWLAGPASVRGESIPNDRWIRWR